MPALDLGRIALHYEDVGPRNAGTPVLLLHELGGSCASFAALIGELAPRRMIAPDFRGAGRSEKPVAAFDIDDVADDVVALLDRIGVAQVDAIGTALGCYVAASLALRHGTRIRRLVLCAVAPEIDARTTAYLRDRAPRIRAQGMRAAVDASLGNAFPEAHAAIRAAYRPLWLANDPAGFAALSLALADCRIGLADWARIAKPSLVLPGAHDFIWSPAHGRAVADAIPGARYAVLETAGHFPHLQDPAGLAAHAGAFLG